MLCTRSVQRNGSTWLAVYIKAIRNFRSGIPGIAVVSIPSREFPGILKASGLSKIVVQHFDKIQQNLPHLLL